MLLATFFLSNYEVGPKVEASVQNFAAGLILAAGNQYNLLYVNYFALTHSILTFIYLSSCWRIVSCAS
jgi:hypothetical protein